MATVASNGPAAAGRRARTSGEADSRIDALQKQRSGRALRPLLSFLTLSSPFKAARGYGCIPAQVAV